MLNEFDNNWKEFLVKKFGENIPEKFIIDLSEIDFVIPSVMATTTNGFKVLARHNQKIGVFS